MSEEEIRFKCGPIVKENGGINIWANFRDSTTILMMIPVILIIFYYTECDVFKFYFISRTISGIDIFYFGL